MSKWIFESDGESFIAFRDDATWQLLQFKDAQAFPLRTESAEEAETVEYSLRSFVTRMCKIFARFHANLANTIRESGTPETAQLGS